jgi:tetratricopeptide (TPR) repeat protein/tRNA A-37 threonylcarbamoyl transferase component Bud32
LLQSQDGSNAVFTQPRPFGNYELLQQIGQGGMGVVYKARQKSPNRLLALKMIKAGALASTVDLQRFCNEAESVAALDHPNIVSIYELAELDGQHFFSMKLFEGGSLDRHIARFANDAKAAARLVATVARTVHHAHQRGILHRDIKPSNILLDAADQPHVTDFGLAKRVESDNGFTQSGAILGTPSYLAPEQVWGHRGAVTVAADVYGLGALLYTLLCGKPPFKADTMLATLELVKTREPAPPRGTNPAVDRDLETICLKCLEKEPARRYGSAEAVAEDLERWLRGEPIVARSVGSVTRLWRWCHRNPVVAGLSAALALLAMFALVGLTYATVASWAKQKEIEAALAEARANHLRAETQRKRAETNFREAFWTIEHILAAFDKSRGKPPATIAELEDYQTGEALRFLRAFCEQPSEDPPVRLQQGVAYVHIGRVYQVLAQHKNAQDAFRQAVTVFEGLVRDFPGNAMYSFELAGALGILAEDLHVAGLSGEAGICYRRAVGVWRNALQSDPTYVDNYFQLALALANPFDPELRDADAALPLARKAIELAPKHPKPWLALGVAYYRAGNWDAANEALQEALRRCKWSDWTKAQVLGHLAMAQWRCGRQAEAMEAYKQAIEVMDQNFDARDLNLREEATAVLGIK